MELLEANFAQIEHLNQILYNNRHHDSWDCFDTALLLEQYPQYGTYNSANPENSKLTKNVVDVRYNSMIVNITHETDATYYTFEVRNSLWDGTYHITHSMNTLLDEDDNFSSQEVEVYTDNSQGTSDSSGNFIKFRVTGEYRQKVRICFHMNITKDGRIIRTTAIQLKHPFEFEHQYDQTVKEEGFIYTETGRPINGAVIRLNPCNKNGELIDEGIPPVILQPKEVINGKFTIPYGATNAPGDYYCLLTAEYENSITTQIVHITKIQKQEIKIEWKPLPKETTADWGDESQYRQVIKGSIREYDIRVKVQDEYGVVNSDVDHLNGLYATVTAKKLTGGKLAQVTCPLEKGDDEYYHIKPTISYREYYESISTLQVSIPSQNGYPAVTKTRKVTHEWKYVDNFSDLKTEINDDYGADWIFLYPKTYTVTQTLTIKPRSDASKITIAGLTGNSQCILKGTGNINLINIANNNAATDNYFKVQLLGLSFIMGSPAIKLSTGGRLLVDNCYFHDNNNVSVNHRGCSIFMPSDDKSKANQKLWKTEVRNSTFYNNKGNEIQSIGKTNIHNNLFKTDNASYLQQPEVKVVSVKAGEVSYTYNKSYIDTGSKPMISNHSYAKALAYIDRNATFNGKGPSQLKNYNTLPLYGKPYHNEAYTYAIYYYPYSGVKTEIVCSPKVGHERKATGHASIAEGFVYYDGYYFVRWEKGRNKGNTSAKNKWTKEELAIPGNQGIFTKDSALFKRGYDPRVSNNYSLHSNLD